MYKIEKDKIIIYDISQFDPMHILECGQIFRYKKNQGEYTVYSSKYKAVIQKSNDSYIILTNNIEYFKHFFDLDNDYNKIKKELTNNTLLDKAIRFGYGIRILNNDLLEMIISFIISANNNIPRIQKSLEYICTHLGQKINDYYTFPTIESLSTANEEFFKKAGTGYRAKYLVDTIRKIYTKEFDIDRLIYLSTKDAREYLMTLMGIGQKVADCILLFGLHRMDVFPVDTWINKIYNENFCTNATTNRALISKELVKKFKNLSGYAQQYLFYYRRSSNV